MTTSSRRLFRAAAVGDEPVPIGARSVADLAVYARPDTPQGELAAARAEAEAIVAQATGETEAARVAAIQQGYEEGLARAVTEIAGALAAAQSLVGALEREHAERPAFAADAAAEVALEVAARLVRAEVAARPERVLDVVRGAIRRSADRRQLVARVNPDDLALCREAAADLLESLGGVDRLEFVEERRVERGGCVLETSGGDVDATFQSQLERLAEALAAPPDAALVEPPT